MDENNQILGTPLLGNHGLSIPNENSYLKQQIDELKSIIQKMNHEITNLKIENSELKSLMQNFQTGENETINEKIEHSYRTDEEELERETNWIMVKSKKRKAKSPPAQTPEPKNINPPNQRNQNSKQQPQISQSQSCQQQSNHQLQQNIIQNTNQQRHQNHVQNSLQKQPPPINISGVSTYAELKEVIVKANLKNYKVIALNNNIWKVNTANPDDYRLLSSTLNEEKIQWHTYENKINRPNKVMVRGLHYTCTKEDIIPDLKAQGFHPLDAVNIIKKESIETDTGILHTRRGLPLFMITFSNEDKTDDIYKIKNIANIKVKIEAIRRNTTRIPQCKRCQGFNHTKKYCNRESRCVKCAGKHLTSECSNSTQTAPKCVNCQGNHPASYRGCEIAKELQKIRNKNRYSRSELPNIEAQIQTNQFEMQTKQYQPQQRHNQIVQYQPTPQMPNSQKRTFSQIVRNQSTQDPNNNGILAEILKNIEKINQRLDQQNNTNEKIFNKINSIELRSQTNQ